MSTIIEKQIFAENTFSQPFPFEGDFNFSIRGVFSVGTIVTVQRSVGSNPFNWLDVDTFTSTGENVGYEPEVLFYRAGIKTGEFVAGTNIFVRFGGKWMTGTPV